MPTQGSFTDFITALEQLHQTVADALTIALERDVRVYRWRPVGQIELPAIYPWVQDSPYEVKATGGLVEDTINVAGRVAGRHVEGAQDGEALEVMIDTYRQIFDSATIEPVTSPFNGIAKVVDRTGMRNVIDRFNDIPVLAMEFPIRAQLNRILAIP